MQLAHRAIILLFMDLQIRTNRLVSRLHSKTYRFCINVHSSTKRLQHFFLMDFGMIFTYRSVSKNQSLVSRLHFKNHRKKFVAIFLVGECTFIPLNKNNNFSKLNAVNDCWPS